MPVLLWVLFGICLPGSPSRAPVTGSSTTVQPTWACRALAAVASRARSWVLSTPVSRNLRLRWNDLMAAAVLSLTSPLIGPVYSPIQASRTG